MMTSSSTPRAGLFAGLLVVSSAAVGCMPPGQASPKAAASAAPPRDERHAYRFDFVVKANDASGAATSSTSFTLNLLESDRGEMVVGKNVPLVPTPPAGPGPGSGSGTSPRQDVGLKVAASFRSMGDDVMLDVVLEMSRMEPSSTIQRVVARGKALASPGKPALVASLDDNHKRYQLSVTPTKLR